MSTHPSPQVRVSPAGTTAFAIAMAAHAAPLEQALKQRPADLSGLGHLPGLPTQLRRLRDELTLTLHDLERTPRPASDPLPPTPKPSPEITTAK